LKKYQVWWTFKENSTLKDYLNNLNIHLPQYFCPSELYSALESIAFANGMMEPGNKEIIIPDRKLRNCLNVSVIYMPDLLSYCQSHVDIVNEKIQNELQNEAIMQEICVEPPEQILYRDTSSVFWLHPNVNYIINNNQKMTYSWNELKKSFETFLKTNTQHITQIDDSIFQIQEDSLLSSLFKFKIFHVQQIDKVLKNITKFLGKTTTLDQYCSKFKCELTDKNFYTMLDLTVNNSYCNKMIPFIDTYISLNKSP
jgi:hypothetical protein